MPVVGISVKEASWESITIILESKDPSLEKKKTVNFKSYAKKHFNRYPVRLMRLEMMKVKVGPDSVPRRLSWGVAKSIILQILLSFESDKPGEQT